MIQNFAVTEIRLEPSVTTIFFLGVMEGGREDCTMSPWIVRRYVYKEIIFTSEIGTSFIQMWTMCLAY